MAMFKMATVLALAIGVSACQSNTASNVFNPVSTHTHQHGVSNMDKYQTLPMTQTALAGQWQLQDNDVKGNKYKALVLEFDNNHVFVKNGCNNLRANYQITNQQLTIGSPISTRMMCEKPLMEIDNLAVDLLKGTAVLEGLTNASSEHTHLKITTVDGRIYTLKRVQ